MKSLSVGICALIAACSVVPEAQADVLPTQLNVSIVRGDGATENIGERAGTVPLVRVEDEHHKPVANAVVMFTLPTDGATGEFGNHSKTLTVITDSEGQAAATGLRTNEVPGKVPIHVSVSYRGLSARASLMQFNVAREGAKVHGHGRKVAVILLLIAGAAAGGAYAALRSGGAASPAAVVVPPPTPIGLTPGTPTIGAPPH